VKRILQGAMTTTLPYILSIIFDKKNRYIAWTGNSDDRPILKNLDGMSRKYPTWIKQQIEKIATHLITKSNIDVIPVIKQAFEDLDYGRFDSKDMQFTEQLDKSPGIPTKLNILV
jgi:DNA polymerase elongation subunit (family B)